jgi:hypothetical protein
MSIRRMTGDWLPTRPFWRDLGERGVRVTAFDVPFVFPGPSRDVLEVMNWGTHDNIAATGERRGDRPPHPPRVRSVADGIRDHRRQDARAARGLS